MIKLILQGMAVGIANILPGVSGGTMLLSIGLYDKLIHHITHLKTDFKEGLRLLLPILTGAVLAILLFSKLFSYLFATYPVPTAFGFCGLIAGGLPAIWEKVKGQSVSIGRIIPFVIFFVLVILFAVIGEESAASVTLSFSPWSMLKLFGIGIIAAATMVIPGISGSMVLMLLGYYTVILSAINKCIDAFLAFDISMLFQTSLILAPFGIGVLIGVFAIAKFIEYLFEKAQIHAYYAILGLICASPIAILLQVDYSNTTAGSLFTGAICFIIGWIATGKLGEKHQ